MEFKKPIKLKGKLEAIRIIEELTDTDVLVEVYKNQGRGRSQCFVVHMLKEDLGLPIERSK